MKKKQLILKAVLIDFLIILAFTLLTLFIIINFFDNTYNLLIALNILVVIDFYLGVFIYEVFIKKFKTRYSLDINIGLTNRDVAFDATMVAMFIVLSKFLTLNFGNIKITIAALPIIISAIYLGLKNTIIVSVSAEFLSQILGYGLTPTTLCWMMPGIVRGILISLFVFILSKKYRGDKTAIKHLEYFIMIIVSGTIVFLLNTGVLIFDAIIFKYSYAYVFTDMIFRFISMIASTVVYTFVSKAVNDKLIKVYKR